MMAITHVRDRSLLTTGGVSMSAQNKTTAAISTLIMRIATTDYSISGPAINRIVE